MMGTEGDQVTVDVTFPPNKQVVWRVIRQHFFANKGIPKTTLLASLRDKYGKESLTNVSQGKAATDDSQIQTILWLFDEQGRPAPLPTAPGKTGPDFTTTQTLTSCFTGADALHLGLVEVYANLYKGQNPQNDWCYKSYTGVFAGLVESSPPELYAQMRIVTMSYPIVLHASEATSKWKKDIAEGQHK